MATTLTRPKFFDTLAFIPGPMGPDGRRTDTAPCGCAITRRKVQDGSLAGHWYGDVRCVVCDEHTRTCEDCGQQVWPHNDCVCDR